LPEGLQKICVQAAALDIQLESVEKYDDYERCEDEVNVLKQDMVVATRRTLKQLKESIETYCYNHTEPREIIESLGRNLIDAEDFLSSTEIASDFTALENTLGYSDEENDKKLFHFLNNRSDEQKRIDFRAACLNLEKHIHSLPKENGHRIVLTDYRDELNKQKADIPVNRLPLMTELTYRWIYKAQNMDKPTSNANIANNRRGKALSQEISTLDWGRILGNLGLLFLGGVVTTAAVLALIPSFGTVAPVYAAAVAGLAGVYTASKGAYETIKSVYGSYKAKRLGNMSYFFSATADETKTLEDKKPDKQLRYYESAGSTDLTRRYSINNSTSYTRF
jgi:hypothetical protein